STTRRRGEWTASPGMRGFSAPRPICRASAGCCSTADVSARGASLCRARAPALSAGAVARMASPSTPAEMRAVRGLGWDIDSPYSSNRGELFPIGSYGHTGFTGTSLWLDPGTRSYVIFLSNRVHPDGKGDVTALRARVATVAAAALITPDDVERSAKAFALREPAERSAKAFALRDPVLAGIDVLAAE